MGRGRPQREKTQTPPLADRRKLAEGEKLLGQCQDLEEVARQLEIAESTWYRRRNQYGGMEADDAKKLKDLD